MCHFKHSYTMGSPAPRYTTLHHDRLNRLGGANHSTVIVEHDIASPTHAITGNAMSTNHRAVVSPFGLAVHEKLLPEPAVYGKGLFCVFVGTDFVRDTRSWSISRLFFAYCLELTTYRILELLKQLFSVAVLRVPFLCGPWNTCRRCREYLD